MWTVLTSIIFEISVFLLKFVTCATKNNRKLGVLLIAFPAERGIIVYNRNTNKMQFKKTTKINGEKEDNLCNIL